MRLGRIVEVPAGRSERRCDPAGYSKPERGGALNIGAVCPRKISLAVVLGPAESLEVSSERKWP